MPQADRSLLVLSGGHPYEEAPFAALLCKKLSAKTLLTIVGCLITLISAYNIYQALN